MINSLSEKIVRALIGRGIILKEKEALYIYGLFLFVSTVLLFAFALLVGILMDLFIESVIFLISFSVIRIFSGGFHAKSEWLCEVSSSIAIILVMLAMKLFKTYHVTIDTMLLISLAAGLIIILFSPIESENKKLSDREKHIFKVITEIITTMFLVIILLSKNIGNYTLSIPIFVSLIYQSILILLAALQKSLKK